MDIRYLDEFVALIKYGSYTAAAKALYMSQSSLSRHVDTLEKEFGCELLFPSINRLVPTAAGKVILERSPEILALCQAMENEVEALSKTRPERIRIQNQLHLGSLFDGISDAMDDTERKYPNVAFDYVDIDDSLTAPEALMAGRVDVAFRFIITKEEYPEKVTPPPSMKHSILSPFITTTACWASV